MLSTTKKISDIKLEILALQERILSRVNGIVCLRSEIESILSAQQGTEEDREGQITLIEHEIAGICDENAHDQRLIEDLEDEIEDLENAY